MVCIIGIIKAVNRIYERDVVEIGCRQWQGFSFGVSGVDLCLINLICQQKKTQIWVVLEEMLWEPTMVQGFLECRSKYFRLYGGNLHAACSKSAEDRRIMYDSIKLSSA